MQIENKERISFFKEQLRIKWGFEFNPGLKYWFPLKVGIPKNIKILELWHDGFEPYIPDYILELKRTGIKGTIVILETNEVFKEEIDLYDTFSYEHVWFDESFDWVIYLSHESSITFGGSLVINAVDNVFPDNKKFLWREHIF